MKTWFETIALRWWATVVGLAVLICGTAVARASAPTLADFGYRRLNANGTPALGTRPLLIIMVQFGSTPLRGRPDYYDRLFFAPPPAPSIDGYFWENSNQRFRWTRAGIIELQLTDAERLPAIPTPDHDVIFQSNIVHQAMVQARDRGEFDFGADGRSSGNTVGHDELQIFIISSDYAYDGGARWFGCVQPPGFSYNVCGVLVHVGDHRGFATICHELSHTLGADDLYATDQGINSTLMRNWGAEEDLFHLDPWHKMQLGWCEPRIRSLRSGGVEQIPAAQGLRPDAPIILYDPDRDISEFFMLEYRTRSSEGYGGYDLNVTNNGLALWAVKHTEQKVAAFVPPFAAGDTAQLGWDRCTKCEDMFFRPHQSQSRCPADHANHAAAGAVFSMVYDNPDAPGQPGWRWCSKCRGLSFGPNQASSRCAAGGTHDGSESRAYTVPTNAIPEGVNQWRWCRKCEGMFFGSYQARSHCPAGGTHDGSQSPDYFMWQYDRGVFIMRWPDLRPGNQFWPSDTTTPYLRWPDRTPTTTRVLVRPFSIGASQITVEWLYEVDVWVDFNYPGGLFFPEFGTFENPFNTVVEGFVAAPWGGRLNFKPGHRAESARFDRRMTVLAPIGPATIGR